MLKSDSEAETWSASESAEPDPESGEQLPGQVQECQPERQQWASSWQFLLTCVAFAVGLGNIWRFPSVVYDNGGGAFLIPYFCCSMVIGFPVLYLELSLGQFSKVGSSVVYGRMWPLFTGCASSLEDDRCDESLGEGRFFYDGACHRADDALALAKRNASLRLGAESPAEQFFNHWLLQKSDHLGPLSPNWLMVGSYALVFTLTALAMYKGTKIIGRMSYFMAVVPYLIIAVLFVRAVTLEGASLGFKYYLTEPDFSVILKPQTWKAAATQVCFSLSVGFGGILSFATYNKKTHNIFRDAFIICFADLFMSVFGGTAVFCTLGFMSLKMGIPIEEVVQDGTTLAFVAYPEALSRFGPFPMPQIFSFLFFFMLFCLGISSEFGFVEAVITSLADQFHFMGRHKSSMTFLSCIGMFLMGLTMCTPSGIFIFKIVSEYFAGFSLTLTIFLEILLVVYCYGLSNYLKGVSIVLLYDQATTMDSYTFGRGDRKYRYPKLALVAVWAFSTIPLLPIPLCALGRLIKFKMQGQSALEMVRCQPGWPSYAERRGLLPPPTSPSSSPGGGASPSSSPSSSSSH